MAIKKKAKVAPSATRRRGGKKMVKKVAKKLAPKAAKSRKAAPQRKKELIHAAPEQCFWVWNGPILRNLLDLDDALRNTISDEQFRFHITGKNDFTTWIDQVLEDKMCATAFTKAKNRKGACTVTMKFLKSYQI